MNYRKKWFSLLPSLCFLMAGCGVDKAQIVQEKVSERVTAFHKRKNEECRERLLQTAERTVDSLLLFEAQVALNDSLARKRPHRPYQPPAVPPIDTLTVTPIFSRPRPASSSGQ